MQKQKTNKDELAKPRQRVIRSNLMATWGCKPNEGVDVNSNLAVSYSKFLIKCIESQGGVLVMPFAI